MVPEATLKRTDAGLVPEGEGWFVLNARDARWGHSEELGSYVTFESESVRFADLGININVLHPGQPNCMYHAEGAQEDFLVLAGECLAIIEEQERPLRAWDFVHCPAEARHVFVATGDTPCVLLAVGARAKGRSLVYPASEVARKHGAGVEQETAKPEEAYARFAELERSGYRDGDLPGL